MVMVDLFSGMGGASAAMRDRGWTVWTLELDRVFRPSIVADVRDLPLKPIRPDLLWASPPCTEFSRSMMPWFRNKKPIDLSCVEAVHLAVAYLQPRFWILENVRGAVAYLGPPRQSFGSLYLWGEFPLILGNRHSWKEKLSGKDKALRARTPYEFSTHVAMAIESAVGQHDTAEGAP